MLTQRNITLALTFGSLAMLLAAWGFQYIGGYAPCKMCYWQRYPHMVAVAAGLLALLIKTRLMPWLGALAMLATGGIGLYHSGVERGLWEGPASCSSTSIGGLSSDELFNQIMSAPLVRCDEIPWQLFGVTMANLNALGAFVLAAGWVWLALRKT